MNILHSIFGHNFSLHYTQEEIWIECSCGKQLDIPDYRLTEAYTKLRNKDLTWKINNGDDNA